MNKFAERLKELRAIKCVTQVQLADSIGISKCTVEMWETAKLEPDFDTLIALSEHFGVSTDAVLGHKTAEAKSGNITNFSVWKQTLTPEFIADSQFLVLSCGCCPANGKTCVKYDTTCRGNFLIWAKAKAEEAM